MTPRFQSSFADDDFLSDWKRLKMAKKSSEVQILFADDIFCWQFFP